MRHGKADIIQLTAPLVKQKTLLNVQAGQMYEVPMDSSKPDLNRIVGINAVIDGDDQLEILKDFSNVESSSFFYDPDTIIFDGDMRARTSYPISTVNDGTEQDYTRWESGTIDFNVISSITKV